VLPPPLRRRRRPLSIATLGRASHPLTSLFSSPLPSLLQTKPQQQATTTAATLPTEEPDGLLVRVDPPDGDETRAGQAVAASAGLEFVRSLGDGLVLMQAKDDPARASSAADALRAAMQRAGTAFPDDGGAGASASVASTTSLPPPSSLVSQAVASAVASARVRRVEPNLIMRVQATASECSSTSCSGLWGMTAIRAPQAWALVGGALAPVAYTVRGSVIDTGVQYDHVELDTQMDRSLGATCVGGRCVAGAYGSDDAGHGTHVSGTIAGESFFFFFFFFSFSSFFFFVRRRERASDGGGRHKRLNPPLASAHNQPNSPATPNPPQTTIKPNHQQANGAAGPEASREC